MRLALPFAGGIVLSFYHPMRDPELFILLIGGLLIIHLLLTFIQKSQLNDSSFLFDGALIYLTMFVLGFSYSGMRIDNLAPGYFEENHVNRIDAYSAIIWDEPKKRPNTTRVTLQITAIKMERHWESAHGKVLAYIRTSDSLHYGDEIVFYTPPQRLKGPKNPGEFDYRKYLSHQGIYHSVFLDTNKYAITGNTPPNPLKAWAIKKRKKPRTGCR